MKKILANIEAERSLLSAIMLNNQHLEDARMILKNGNTFFHPLHQKIFDAMIKLNESGIEIDAVSLYENLKNEGITAAEISKLHEAASQNPFYTTRVVYRYWLFRKMVEQSNAVIKLAEKGTEDEFELLERAIQSFESINSQLEFMKQENDFNARIESVYDEIAKERISNVETAFTCEVFPNFNKATGGVKPGNLVVISGDYKKGKSTFGLSLLLDFATNKKINSGILSLEMSLEEIDKKIISLLTGIRYGYLRNPQVRKDGSYLLDDEQLLKSARTLKQKFDHVKLFISDEMVDQNGISAKIKYWVRKHNLKIILVDYIGLIETSERYERRDLEIAALSRFFKLLAKRLNVVIIILSQENNEGKIAESKALSRDADFWFSITHPYDDVKKNKLELYQKIIYNGQELNLKLDESLYLVELKASRHTANGTRILCQYHRNGTFNEIDPNRMKSEQEYFAAVEEEETEKIFG